MTTFRILLRCLPNGRGSWDFSTAVEHDYRIQAWSKEEAINRARQHALAAGYQRTIVASCMPAFAVELPK